MKAYVQLAVAMMIVGSSVLAGKLMVTGLPVFFASGLRFAIASLILLPLWSRLEKDRPSLERKEFALLFLQAFAGVFLFNVCMLYGVRLTTAAEAGIITSTTPAVAGLIAFLF